MIYTQTEVMARTGLSRTRLSQLREGYVNTQRGKRYSIAPVLIRGTHWYRDEAGRPVYTDAGLALLLSERGSNARAASTASAG